MEVYRFVIRPLPGRDPRAAGLLADAHALGIKAVQAIDCLDLFFIEGQIAENDLDRIARELLSDPITQTADWGRIVYHPDQAATGSTAPQTLEVALRPGVTDPVAEQVVRAAHELGIAGVHRAATGQRYEVTGSGVSDSTLDLLARRLLSNPVIQRYALGEIEPAFPHPAEASGQVSVIPLRDLDHNGLLNLSQERRAALDLAEMLAIQQYFQKAGREPTDVEFEMIAQTWSEHCVHKTFKARIQVAGQAEVNGILKTYLKAATDAIAAPWVRSAFIDNAGIIDFDDDFEISFKVETHNHPSAIEPFGGANTGVGGVIRDVLGVSARPIAATDVLCFGPQDMPPEGAPGGVPSGVLHPRRIQSGVVAGVQDYGNKIGIPTVNGAILYDPGYTANPLVFCGCVGLAPKNRHVRQPNPGDRMVVLGGRTGRDGLRGATFSSMTMDAQTGEVAGASVQIGDPITEKGLIEVILRARDAGLYTAITDCGAGGLSSAVGEMSSQSGGVAELKDVRLKYPGLAPWEIWLSEAQERMVLAVPPRNLDALAGLCSIYEVEWTDIGSFNDSGRLVVQYEGCTVLDLENDFLHEGIPQRQMKAVIPAPAQPPSSLAAKDTGDPAAALLALLADPNVSSKEAVIRLYDHEVQGGTAVKPLTGAAEDGPSDACVLKPAGTVGPRGIVLSAGINPAYGKKNAYAMALSVVDEAVRNAVAVGANPERLALLDNFCWGDPKRPETLGSLLEAARGCHDAALLFKSPFISGKDSLNNEYLGTDGQRHAIPPTLLISAIALIEDVGKAVTMDLKTPGSAVYLLGQLSAVEQAVPGLPGHAPALYIALHEAMRRDLVLACHDLSEGGIIAAAAEMCIGGRVGMSLEIDPALLFTESNACLLVEIHPDNTPFFEAAINEKAPGCCRRVGFVQAAPALQVVHQGQPVLQVALEDLVRAWKGIG